MIFDTVSLAVGKTNFYLIEFYYNVLLFRKKKYQKSV